MGDLPRPDFDALLAYTEWERRQWREELGARDDGAALLGVSVGPHNDGRFETVGALIGHIFSAERRYVDRLSGRAPSSTTEMPVDAVEPLFLEGECSRRALVEWIDGCPPGDWDEMREYQVLTYRLTATPRKIVSHVLLHETRHWAQVATLLRLSGARFGFRDFLASPVLGGELRPDGT